MIKSLLPVFLLILAFLFNPFFSKNINAAEVPKIKVLSFNKGPWYFLEGDARPQILADFVKAQNIEIVGLQEGRYKSETVSEGLLLKKAFEKINYPMYIIQVVETKHEGNIILSKYPFVEGTYTETLFRERNRIIQRVAVATPYGKLWVTNIHTHFVDPCDGTAKILNHALTPNGTYSPDQNNIIVGDFNATLSDDKPTLNPCRDSSYHKTAQNLLYNFRVNCLNTSYCFNFNKDPNKRGIDWIITTKQSPLQLEAVWVDGSIQSIGDGHPPIVGLIQSNTFTPAKNYDFNNDGILNLKDIVSFINYMLKNPPQEIKYDYNNDRKVDIKDVIKIIKSTIA